MLVTMACKCDKCSLYLKKHQGFIIKKKSPAAKSFSTSFFVAVQLCLKMLMRALTLSQNLKGTSHKTKTI